MRAGLVAVLVMLGVTPQARAQDAADSTLTHPVSVIASYAGEPVADVVGGLRRGMAYTALVGVQLTILPEPLVGWHDARFFAMGLGMHGGIPSHLVGDVQGVSNLQAPQALRLEELWLQQNLVADRLSVLVGRYDLNSEFYRLESAGLFVNASFGIGPEFSESGVAGPSIYPNTAVGTRIAVEPSRHLVWRTAVLDGVPLDRPGDGIRPFAPGDGVLLVSEVSLLSHPGEAGPHSRRLTIGRGAAHPYRGKVALGAWYYTARFPDLVDTLATGAPVLHQGSAGAYLLADQTLWSSGRDAARALHAFLQLGLGDARVNQIGHYVGAGVTLTEPLPGRAHDEMGLGIAAARNGSHWTRALPAADLPAGGESVVEFTYLAQLTPWLAAQPDLQYVIHPGGTRAIRNTLVPGLLIALSH